MSDNFISTASQATGYINLVAEVAKSITKSAYNTISGAHDKNNFMRAIGGKITPESTTTLVTKGLGYQKLCERLDEAKIPNMAMAVSPDNSVVILIPSQRAHDAEIIIDNLNAEKTPTEAHHISDAVKPGEPSVTFSNLSKEELFVVRKFLVGTHSNYHISERGDKTGSITVASGGEKEKLVEQAVIGARYYLSGEAGRTRQEEIDRVMTVQKEVHNTLKQVNANKKIVYIGNEANSNIYQINKQGVYLVAQNGKVLKDPKLEIDRERIDNDRVYAAKVNTLISDMKGARIETRDASLREDPGSITNGMIIDIARYKEGMIHDLVNNGYAYLATADHLIQTLNVDGKGPDMEIVNSIGNHTRTITEESYRMSIDEVTEILSMSQSHSHPAIVDAPVSEIMQALQNIENVPDGKALQVFEKLLTEQYPAYKDKVFVAMKDEIRSILDAYQKTADNREEENNAIPVIDKDNDRERDHELISNALDRDDDVTELPDDDIPEIDD